MNAEFKPVKLEDLKLDPADAKLIADGAAVFLRPQPDPEDDERLIKDSIDDTGN